MSIILYANGQLAADTRSLQDNKNFTNISICAYAAYKKDLSLIRTMTRQDMETIVQQKLDKPKAKGNK